MPSDVAPAVSIVPEKPRPDKIAGPSLSVVVVDPLTTTISVPEVGNETTTPLGPVKTPPGVNVCPLRVRAVGLGVGTAPAGIAKALPGVMGKVRLPTVIMGDGAVRGIVWPLSMMSEPLVGKDTGVLSTVIALPGVRVWSSIIKFEKADVARGMIREPMIREPVRGMA